MRESWTALSIVATRKKSMTYHYRLYPTVQRIGYTDHDIALPSIADVQCGEGIDDAARQRLQECLNIRQIAMSPHLIRFSATPSDGTLPPVTQKLTIAVGIVDSNDASDRIARALLRSHELQAYDMCFERFDSYMLAVIPPRNEHGGIILILGKNNDGVFYGLTTLYQIFRQCKGGNIHELEIQDWPDIHSRGFIEGYYGSPWSVEDRVDLMMWAGHYKLNTYVYAPKDDDLHRNDWRTLYTERQIETEIKPQAAAGNASKVRFVYALAPFHNEGVAQGKQFRFDTEDHYREDFATLTNKYLQTIEAGVRQVALLADDSTNWADIYGSEATYLRILTDLTQWIHGLQKLMDVSGEPQYPGLKDTILFCPALYTYTTYGEDWYGLLPPNIRIIMTGGRVFGSANQRFADEFAHRTSIQGQHGRAPFMWINWPCSDMNRNTDYQYLVMGGQGTFLQYGVKPGAFDGIMLNPMQQSEPSKQAIFMAADYAWHLWQTQEEGRSSWENSFSHIENNRLQPTTGSRALRDLSMHMRVLPDDGLDRIHHDDGYDERHHWWLDEESIDYSAENKAGSFAVIETLGRLTTALASNTLSIDMLNEAMSIYSRLHDAAQTYAQHASNTRMFAQIEPFIGFWSDLTQAMLEYLESAQCTINGDIPAALKSYACANRDFAASDEHTIDDYYHQAKPARGGMSVIRPAVIALSQWLAQKLESQQTL